MHCIPVISKVTSTTTTKQFHELIALYFAWWKVLVGVFPGLPFELEGVNQELVCHSMWAKCLSGIFEVDVGG